MNAGREGSPMKLQVRLLFLFATLALAAGWLGVRSENAVLAARIGGGP